MGAFNRRLEPKEIGGMPLTGAVALVAALVFTSVAIITPGYFKIIPGVFLCASLITAGVAFTFQAQLPFLWVIWLGRVVEPRRVTVETRTRL